MEQSVTVQDLRKVQADASRELVEEQRMLLAAYASCFGTNAGAIVLAQWEKTMGRRISFVPNDPYMSAYQEGQRSVLLETQENIEKGRAL